MMAKQISTRNFAIRPFAQRSQRSVHRVCSVARRTIVRAQTNSQPNAVQYVQGLALGAAVAAGLALSSIEPAAAQGIRVKGLPGGGSDEELSEKYMQSVDKKRLQKAKRKEALAKKREEALRAGASEAETPSADPKVVAANAEVERSNAQREKDAEKMMAAIRGKSAERYTKTADKAPGLLS